MNPLFWEGFWYVAGATMGAGSALISILVLGSLIRGMAKGLLGRDEQ